MPDGVKMRAESYDNFLKKNFLPWYKKQPLALKRKMIFMHDHASSDAARYTHEVFNLAKFGFKEARLISVASMFTRSHPQLRTSGHH